MHLTPSFETIRVRHALGSQRLFRLLCACLLLIGVASMPRAAWAVCWFTSGSAPTVSFNAGTIDLTVGAQPSTTVPIWSSGVITPPGNTQIQCDGTTNSGVGQSIAGPPTGGDDTLFPTNIPGISYRLKHIADPDPSYNLPAYPNSPIATGSYRLSGTTQMLLYYTGPYLPPNGGSISGSLSQWNADICRDPNLTGNGRYKSCNSAVTPQSLEYFSISAIIKIQVPTCNVAPTSVSTTVTLPSVTAAQLNSNPTPGSTPFSLQLVNCPANEKVLINLNTSSPFAGGTGVIAPTAGAGYATNVGVQILQADGATPVTFGDDPAQAINTGTTSSSNYAINLFARYYRTATPVTAGSVKGVATYTINYQ